MGEGERWGNISELELGQWKKEREIEEMYICSIWRVFMGVRESEQSEMTQSWDKYLNMKWKHN